MQETIPGYFSTTIPDHLGLKSRWWIGIDAFFRRSIDLTGAILGLFFLAPFLILIGLLIKRDSPGPVFFRGKRLGKKGKEFPILKFRTMYENSASYAGARVTPHDDKRITPLGHWLRQTKINELPQLWNVLKGEMALVGPRPEDPELAKAWPPEAREEILSVRPGITSPASVLYRDEEKMLTGPKADQDYVSEILPSKIRLDVVYVRNRTVLTDLDVILWTAIVLLPLLRSYPIPNHLLYWGPVSRLFSRFLNWFAIDFIVSFFAISAAGVIWRLNGPLNVGVFESVVLAMGIALLFSVLNQIGGLNRLSWSTASAAHGIDLAFSSGLATFVFWALNGAILRAEPLPVSMIIFTGTMAYIGFLGVRYRERLITGLASRLLGDRRRIQAIGERVLIVGAGDMGEFAAWLLHRGEFNRAFSIMGMVDDDPRKIGMVVAGVSILGSTDKVPDLVKKMDIGIIIFAIAAISAEQKERILQICQSTSIRLVYFSELVDQVKSSMRAFPLEKPLTKAALDNVGQPGVTTAWLDQVDLLLEEGQVELAQKKIRDAKRNLMEQNL